jgi:hypothetical protein
MEEVRLGPIAPFDEAGETGGVLPNFFEQVGTVNGVESIGVVNSQHSLLVGWDGGV